MFHNKTSLELSTLPSSLKDELLKQIARQGILNESKKLCEKHLNALIHRVINIVHQRTKARYEKNNSPHIAFVELTLNKCTSTHKQLLRKKLQEIIRSQHADKIIANFPTKKTDAQLYTWIKDQIKTYSTRERTGIDKDAIISYLQDLIFMARFSLNKKPIKKLIDLLEDHTPFKKWLTSQLRDDPTSSTSDLWNSGNHEWLPCCLITDVLKRSAGLAPGVIASVKSFHENDCFIIDWLTIHNQLRSPVKRLYFKNDNNAIESGHTPAVRKSKTGSTTSGVKSGGSAAFHKDLEKAFEKSTSPREFIRRVRKVSHKHLISGKKHLQPSATKAYTIEGVKTNNETDINQLRHEKLLPAFRARKNLMLSLNLLTIRKNDGNNINSPSTTATEYTPGRSPRTPR